MCMKPQKTGISFLTLISQCLIISASYCDRPNTLVQQVLDADYVVYGSIVNLYAQLNIGPRSYLAEMDIKCILKAPRGQLLDRLINITAGLYQ